MSTSRLRASPKTRLPLPVSMERNLRHIRAAEARFTAHTYPIARARTFMGLTTALGIPANPELTAYIFRGSAFPIHSISAKTFGIGLRGTQLRANTTSG